jgi:ferredoxin-NADP reductase
MMQNMQQRISDSVQREIQQVLTRFRVIECGPKYTNTHIIACCVSSALMQFVRATCKFTGLRGDQVHFNLPGRRVRRGEVGGEGSKGKGKKIH